MSWSLVDSHGWVPLALVIAWLLLTERVKR